MLGGNNRFTRPDARKKPLQTSENDLLVIAVPVYMGRLPALLSEWLHEIKADKTPTVCIVVYGNFSYEDALLELKDIMKKVGVFRSPAGHLLESTPSQVPTRPLQYLVLMGLT